MKFALLDPQFVGSYHPGGYRRLDTIDGAQGVLFQCPLCSEGKPPGEPDGRGFRGAHYILAWFANPINAPRVPDDADPKPGRWVATGTTFENLSLSPSILLQGGCGWHGYVTNGMTSTC